MRIPDVGPSLTPDPLRNIKLMLNLPRFTKLYWRLFLDKRVTIFPKIILVVGVLYWACPVDAVAFIPTVDWIDDTAVMALALWGFIKLCPPRVVAEHIQIIDHGG